MMLRRFMVLTALVVTCVTMAGAMPATAVGCPRPPDPSNRAAYYDFVNTFRSACASHRNWDRTFDDVTVNTTVDGRNTVSVTAATTLAGALASLRVGGKEFLASGGHGAALQYAFHAWDEGAASTECYNPTQAGARIDDRGHAPPYHGPSTSALYELSRQDRASVRTSARPAMFITRADPDPGWAGCRATNYQPNRSPYTYGLAPYWLNTRVQLSPDHALTGLDNVIRLTATLTSEDRLYPNFDGVLIAYLQRDFTEVYSYDPARRTLVARPASQHADTLPAVRCTAGGAYCLGMYFRPAAMPQAYYYTMTRGPLAYNGMFGEYTMQVTMPYRNVGAGGTTSLRSELYLAVGNAAQVADTLRVLSVRVR